MKINAIYTDYRNTYCNDGITEQNYALFHVIEISYRFSKFFEDRCP